ncbi:MAG: 6-carboxytetrahydropterin synthase [Spirochaetia bacterium]|nr:6-carboxytetrahydropterin synthase [Spirochaetia bacterium]
MTYRIQKRFRFEAAHRLLPPYAGKCSSNHGHSWSVTISLESGSLDPSGMVFDFDGLKPLKHWIDDALDHASLLREDDALLVHLKKEGHKTFPTEKNPSSEHLAEVILKKANDLFKSEIRSGRFSVVSVVVNETCTARAEVRP